MKGWICLLLACVPAWAAEVKEVAVEHAGVKFRVVTLEASRVGLVWRDPEGEAFATFDKVQAHHAAKGKRVKFLMNAGIYEPGSVPSGLHVENGEMLRPLNLKDGEGNFFLKPNGVFGLFEGEPGKAFIEESGAFAARQRGQAKGLVFAIQGGPMLLSGGARHPKFMDGSPNKKLRNGMGVDAQGRVVFAITAAGEEVNFWDFAGLFLKLGCKDALFLDGDISKMVVNPDQPVPSNRFAAMFVVAE